MKAKDTKIIWPNGNSSFEKEGEDWIKAAFKAGFEIPTGCLVGSCGACEIEVNGEVIRACIKNIPRANLLKVNLYMDPYW